MISCLDLFYSRFGMTAFRGLGFTLLDGALLSVRGGSARTTRELLCILAGKRPAPRGIVSFNDNPAYDNPDYANHVLLLDRESASPHRTVQENVAAFDGAPATAVLVAASLHYFGLSLFAQMPFAKLPPMLQRRALLARLLAAPRPFWFIDASLMPEDDEGKALLFAVIVNRCNTNGIVVIATDEMHFITPMQTLDLRDFR